MNWRTWLYETLSGDAALAALLPQLDDGSPAIHGAGSLHHSPEYRPFCIVRLEPEVPGPFPGVSNGRAVLYWHDEPGDYLRIGELLKASRAALTQAQGNVGQVPQPTGVACVWMGDSADLSDDLYGTIMRTNTFDLHGRIQ